MCMYWTLDKVSFTLCRKFPQSTSNPRLIKKNSFIILHTQARRQLLILGGNQRYLLVGTSLCGGCNLLMEWGLYICQNLVWDYSKCYHTCRCAYYCVVINTMPVQGCSCKRNKSPNHHIFFTEFIKCFQKWLKKVDSNPSPRRKSSV